MGTEDQRTVYCGNLSERVTEELLYELFLQAAPIERVKIPKDMHGRTSSYGFVTFKHLESVQYAIELLNGTSLFDRKLNLKMRNAGASGAREQPSFQKSVPGNIPIDPSKLMCMGENMRLSNVVQNSSDTYGGGNRYPSGGNRWERNNSYRDEKRSDSYPYRYESNRGNVGHYGSRRNYDNNSNNYSRNRRRY